MAAHFIHGKGTKSSDMKLSDYSDELNYLVLHIYYCVFRQTSEELVVSVIPMWGPTKSK